MSIFEREPHVPHAKKQLSTSALYHLRPQLDWIEEGHFAGPNAKWPERTFEHVITFPLVAGYSLGLIEGILRANNIQPTEAETLEFVILTQLLFEMNHADVNLTRCYMYPGETFKLGLDMGVFEVVHRFEQKALTGRFEGDYKLLALLLEIFLKYDDSETIKLNLKIFCDMHGIESRDDDTLDNIVDRWDTHMRD